MKLPRWLVIAMLTTSVLAVLARAGWWWVTWPERTAREFVQSMVDGDGDRVLRMAQITPTLPSYKREIVSKILKSDWSNTRLHSNDRTVSEILGASQKFETDRVFTRFEVVRGRVTLSKGTLAFYAIAGTEFVDEDDF